MTCTSCQKTTDRIRTDYRTRDEAGQWVVIIGPDEKLCLTCAGKRGAKGLAEIYREMEKV